jgi:hypothetical protein
MSFILAKHPSPRPGFTHVADAQARRHGPVVVVVSDSPGGITALRRAAEEAALHSVPLYVLDVCSPRGLKERLLEDADGFDDRDRSVALSILRNPNVTIRPAEGAGSHDIVASCRQIGGSLLVVDPACLGADEKLGELVRSVNQDMGHTLDILVVNEQELASH